jgi:hypothetical protein
MAKKEYLLVGVGYTAHFNSIKERNAFKKQVSGIFKTMSKVPKFADNKSVLESAIVIAIAKQMKVKVETRA